jgi:hypothetical protein
LICTDNDGDGYPVEGGGVFCSPVDCNDSNSTAYPGAPDIICDGVDNNCDGTPDDAYVSVLCDGSDSDFCAEGTTSCSAGSIVCSDNTGSTVETCNSIDDDCNGAVDDGIPSAPTSCGVGACASTSALSCVGGSMVDSCVPGTPSAEVCNGIDDDCDGAVDEGLLIRVGAVYYSSLQTAYNWAGQGSVIQIQDVQLIENLNANINWTVTIDGGYADCSYAVKTGRTRLKGQITISNGKVTGKDVILEQ